MKENNTIKRGLLHALILFVLGNVSAQEDNSLQFTVNALTKKSFNFSAAAPEFTIRQVQQNNMTFHQLSMPGGRRFGETGEPGLPGFTRMVVVPQMAEVQVTILEGNPEVYDNVLVYPVQPRLPEPTQQPPDFTINSKLYQTNDTYPQSLYTIQYDRVRGCRIALINVHCCRYNPAHRRLLYYRDIEVDIQFEGSNEVYIPETRKSMFFESIYGEIFQNYEVDEVEAADLLTVIPFRERCDFLIVTADEFETQADELAGWKEGCGLITKVSTLSEIEIAQGGTSAAHIRDHIKDNYLFSNLSYVLLLGDAEFIPVHYETIHSHPSHRDTLTGTDLYYAEMDYEGFFPDLAIGRIPVDTADQAQIVVDKIINYEQTPPSNRDFYKSVLNVAYFEDLLGDIAGTWESDGRADKVFVEALEEVRHYLFWEGYTHLPRQYDTETTYWPEGHEGPQWYTNRDPLPADLLMPDFAWDGDADGINEEINAGTFLVLYRGHGVRHGWTSPRYQIGFPDYEEPLGNLAGLDNGHLTPVVLSLTCKSGWFDTETDAESLNSEPDDLSLAEGFLRMDGGAVAVVASTRVSSGMGNNLMLHAMIDCIWNGMLPHFPVEEGDASLLEGSKRLGDVLNYAKFYLIAQDELVAGDDYYLEQFEINHLLGDPTMEIWTECPYVHPPLVEDHHVFQPIRPFEMEYVLPLDMPDVFVSLIQDGMIIGQGISGKGQAVITFDSPLLYTTNTVISFSRNGHMTKVLPIQITNPIQGKAEMQSSAEFIGSGQPLVCTIHFENGHDALAAVKELTITGQLDEDLNWSTLKLLEVGFGDHRVHLPGDTTEYEGSLNMDGWTYNNKEGWHTGDTPLSVEIKTKFSSKTGTLLWNIACFDPKTNQKPEDVYCGFLPPESLFNKGPRSQGYVSFSIQPKDGLPSGINISSGASLDFDNSPPVTTKIVQSMVDNTPPESSVAELPQATADTSFEVKWSGKDNTPGSGIAGFDIYYSTDGGMFALWLTSSENSAVFTGDAGRTYSFYSVAVDSAGNVEAAPARPDAQTAIDVTAAAAFLRGDANIDGQRNIADAVFVLSYLFEGSTTSCLDSADANDDGSINIADAVMLLSHLFAGAGNLPPPFSECGTDETADLLNCLIYQHCP